MPGKLEKFAIHAYMDDTFIKEYPSSPLHLQVNPEQYSLDHTIDYNTAQEQGKSGNNQSYNKNRPRQLQFEFLFDQTGAIDGSEETENGVQDQVDQFHDFTTKYEGEIHQPKFLKLAWGTLTFKCKLQNFNVSYELFNASGKPLRARLNATFSEYMDEKLQAKLMNNLSPDTATVKTLKEGDKLPLMANEKYGSVNHVPEIARANKLPRLRNINTGQKIKFPPVKKN